MKKSIVIELHSVPEDSAVLGSLLGEFLDESRVSARAKYDVLISCDEVFSNIYMHGYGKEPYGRIQVNAELGEGGITITFTDYSGNGMPDGKPAGIPADKTGEGGYGLFIIHELMDEIRTFRTGAANMIIMKKNIREADREADI